MLISPSINERPPVVAIAMLSATALAYEILLMRLFSIIQWHHFAYMVISLALLGYGFSGTLIAFSRNILVKHFHLIFPASCFLFSISSLLAFQFAQSIPFNMEAMLWDGKQPLYLLSIFLSLSIPFLMAALAICLNFIYFPAYIGMLYGADLLGAGLGSILIIMLLFFVFPTTALAIIISVGLFATIVAIWEIGYCRVKPTLLLTPTLILILLLGYVSMTVPSQPLNISPYKSLQQTLNIKGSDVIFKTSGPLGLLNVLSNQEIPFRHAPGLSLNNTQIPLPQLALFSDADNMTAITQFPQSISQLAYLDQLSSALPFHLSSVPKTLIVGAGGGSDILQAIFHQVKTIDVVEYNPQMIEIFSHHFADYSGRLSERKGINFIHGDIRGYLSQTDTKYDLLQISLMDSFNASSSGLYALHESYLYTQEALAGYLRHINPSGFLAISRWVKVPPRDGLKIFATAIQALKQLGIDKPEQHLMMIRGWQTSTLLIKNSPITTKEIKALKQFCHKRSFDLAWYPGIEAKDSNQYNRFREAYFYQGAKALLSDHASEFMTQYKYYIYPANDDKPFFHHFFKWPLLMELVNMPEQGAVILLEMSYLTLVATLVIAILVSISLAAIPLIKFSNLHRKNSTWQNRKLFIYFFSLGLAFLFIEIALMQKFILFLHHPIYTIPVVLSAFLIFAGIGSILSQFLLKKIAYKRLLNLSISTIIIISLLYTGILPPLFDTFISLLMPIKILLVLIIIAPLAIAMGMPFPLALDYLGKNAPEFISWAWGINGYASVISTVLATLLAIHMGFNCVILLACFLYFASYLSFPYSPQGNI